MRQRGTLGPYLRGLREAQGLGLREFCLRGGIDPGNYSRVERGVVLSPGEKLIETYLGVLGVEVGSEEWYHALDLAAADRGKLPSDLMSDRELVEKLPVVFKALRRGMLEHLIERIREEWE